MKRTHILFMFVTVICLHPRAYACDVCGCSANNLGIGLLTDYKSNFLRISYFKSRFRSFSGHEYVVSDQFHQWELSFRHSVGKRFRIMASLPYRLNIRNSEIEFHPLRASGFSDLRVIGSYVLFNHALGLKSSFYLETGAGVNIPSGQFDADIPDRNLPENFNVGLGSWGHILQANAAVNTGKTGIVYSINYQWNRPTPGGYDFGNQLTTQMTAFHEIQWKKWKFIPNAGISLEKTGKDKYANGNHVPGTSGNGLFISTGLGLKFGSLFTGLSYMIPLTNEYSGGDIIAKNRFSAHFTFVF